MPRFCDNCLVEMVLNDKGNEYRCPQCGEYYNYPDYEEIYDDIPEGCVACGGPYPDCMDGCDMYDD